MAKIIRRVIPIGAIGEFITPPWCKGVWRIYYRLLVARAHFPNRAHEEPRYLPQQRMKNADMMWVKEGAISSRNAIRPGSIVRGKRCSQANQLNLYNASASDGRSVVASRP